jgi:hypothetical protein
MSPVEFRNIELALEFRVATRRIRAIEFAWAISYVALAILGFIALTTA